jgi:hypothetical protein
MRWKTEGSFLWGIVSLSMNSLSAKRCLQSFGFQRSVFNAF